MGNRESRLQYVCFCEEKKRKHLSFHFPLSFSSCRISFQHQGISEPLYQTSSPILIYSFTHSLTDAVGDQIRESKLLEQMNEDRERETVQQVSRHIMTLPNR